MINIHKITGRLNKIRFRNDENQYTIADFLSEDTGSTITTVGYLIGVNEGEKLCISGSWEKHAKYGQQFKIESYEPLLPTSMEDIKSYLRSLNIKGLSPKKINTLVKKFKEKTLEIIENTPDELKAIKGVGKVLADRVIEAWDKHNQIRNLISFLQEYSIPVTHSASIYKQYAGDAMHVITRNPYRLAFDIPEMDFTLIDSTARQLGIDRNDPQRINACILYLLERFASEGHVYSDKATLSERCGVLFGIDPELVDKSMLNLSEEHRIVIESTSDNPDVKAVYSKHLHQAETGISNTLSALNSLPVHQVDLDKNEIIEEVLKTLAIKLAEEQLEALNEILAHRVAVITGGPGTGKTTLIRSVTAIYKRLGKKTLLAAPTGRAARRLSEVTGHDAATIHKMLQYNFRDGRFEKNRDEPLEAEAIIIDEASMIDTPLMYHLLNAVPFSASIIFVGDVFQLPSVGPGTVLSDLIKSEKFKTFELTKIFRQAQESPIILNSHRIRYGKPLKIPEENNKEELSEFYFIETANPVTVMERVVELCCRRIPDSYHLDPMTEIQILTPMHKGDVGTISLNNALQKVLNPTKKHIESFGRFFKEGDKVMHLKNNYEKEVFNGDIGTISHINTADKLLTVNYYGNHVEYEPDELNELSLAYAISVHKSQGSEYPAVVVPITTQHRPLLQRNLLYTAMTRGKKLVILIGTKKALSIALNNDRPKQRLSGLAGRLADSRL